MAPIATAAATYNTAQNGTIVLRGQRYPIVGAAALVGVARIAHVVAPTFGVWGLSPRAAISIVVALILLSTQIVT